MRFDFRQFAMTVLTIALAAVMVLMMLAALLMTDEEVQRLKQGRNSGVTVGR